VSVYKIISRNNASIFNFRIFFDGKVSLVSALWGGENLKFPVVKCRKRQINKNQEKTGIYTQIDFCFWCNSITNDHRYVKF